MAKKLKTGDVRKFSRESISFHQGDKWMCVGARNSFPPVGYRTREIARCNQWIQQGERIARILSIGPKYVTVRISK